MNGTQLSMYKMTHTHNLTLVNFSDKFYDFRKFKKYCDKFLPCVFVSGKS